MPAPPRPVATSGTGPAATRAGALRAAAAKWHIPYAILYGVYGVETAYGTNIATSSAGAQGAFQFLPSTAKAYDYPLTNDVSGDVFAKQADAAAHYLHDLFAQHGSWDGALHAYSGGGYGLAKVQAAARGKADPHANLGDPAGAVAGAAGDVAGAVGDVAQAPAKLLAILADPDTWRRLAQAVLGIALLLMGLKQFGIDPVGVAIRTAGTVKAGAGAIR